jgi:hypothetical protein
MEKSSRILRGLLLTIVFLALFMPIIQDKFEFIEVKPLNGDIPGDQKDSLTFKTWFSGRYQDKMETFVTNLFGLRSFCVRVNNQVAFSLFKVAKANNVIVGKENYLYEEKYITSYMGKDFIGEKRGAEVLKNLKFVSDKLAQMNKQLILVLAAGKASYYPEFIPDRYKRVNEQTNYKFLAQKAKEAGIHVIDVNAWFMAEKNKAPYPLYPKYGIHWSEYGSVLAADTIVKTIERLRNIDMPDIKIEKITMGPPDGIDYDIGDGMNIFERLQSFDMANVKLKSESDTGKTKPNVLVISDSFYWGMYGWGIANCFNNHHFWFYNKQVYPESFKEETFVGTLNFRQCIDKHDVVILMATENNLFDLGWGFLERAAKIYQGFDPPHSKKYYEKIKQLAAYIMTDTEWLRSAAKHAKENGVTLQAQVYKEAEWTISNDEHNY